MTQPNLTVAEMSAEEYRTAIKGFLSTVGIRAEAYTSLNEAGPLFHVSFYPQGIARSSIRSDDNYLRVEGDTFSELYQKLTDGWAEYEARYKTQTIRKMALAIIRITADLGECTDAALRNCGEFDSAQVARYGAQACADANEIADKGPFSIITIGGANAEAA